MTVTGRRRLEQLRALGFLRSLSDDELERRLREDRPDADLDEQSIPARELVEMDPDRAWAGDVECDAYEGGGAYEA